MLSLFSAQLLKRYGHFSGLGVEIALSHRHVDKRLFFRVKRIQQSTASMRTSWLLLNQQTRVATRIMC